MRLAFLVVLAVTLSGCLGVARYAVRGEHVPPAFLSGPELVEHIAAIDESIEWATNNLKETEERQASISANALFRWYFSREIRTNVNEVKNLESYLNRLLFRRQALATQLSLVTGASGLAGATALVPRGGTDESDGSDGVQLPPGIRPPRTRLK